MATLNENASWKSKHVLIIAAILFVVGLLLGFIPEYRRASQLQGELGAREASIQHLEREQALAKVRDLASLLYLEVTRKNFGIAGQHATSLFDAVRTMASSTPDPGAKSTLGNILSQRDAIIARIAKGDASVETPIREILDRLHQVTVP